MYRGPDWWEECQEYHTRMIWECIQIYMENMGGRCIFYLGILILHWYLVHGIYKGTEMVKGVYFIWMTGEFLQIQGIYDGTGMAKLVGRSISYLDDHPNTLIIQIHWIYNYKGSGMTNLMGRRCIFHLDNCRVHPNTRNIRRIRNG